MRVREAQLKRLREVSEDAYRLAADPRVAAQLSNVDLVRLRDEVVGGELMQAGFGEDWEPNAYGLFLEGLIDVITDERIGREST